MKSKLLISLLLILSSIAQARREPSSLYIKERAAARTDYAAWGQWWVLNANPNEPWFTDGDGTDYEFALQNTSPTFAGLKCTSFLDIAEHATPDTPASGILRLYTEDYKGFSFFSFKDDTGMERKIVRDSVFVGKNVTGSAIALGRIVYATGNADDVPTIALAKADSSTTMPAIGVTIERIEDGAFGRVMQVGLIENVNTLAYSVGDIFYVSAATEGIPTTTPPAYPNLRQEIGTVLVDSDTVGAIQIVARSVFNDAVIDHGGLMNLTGQGVGGGADDHGLGSDDSPTFAGGTIEGDFLLINQVNVNRNVYWDESFDLFEFKDNTIMGIGSGLGGAGNSDVMFKWDGDSLEIDAIAVDTTVNIGDATFGFDIFINSTTDGDYALFDYGDKRLIMEDYSIAMQNDDRIYFNSDLSLWIYGDSSWLYIGTGSGDKINITDVTRIDAKLAFTQADENEYIDSLGDGYMDYGATTAHRFNNKLEIEDSSTYIEKDGSNNMSFTDAVYGTKTLSEMGSPTMVNVTESTVSEGYNDIGSFNDKVLILTIAVTTSATDWTFKAVPDDDQDGAGAVTLVSNRSGNYTIYWNYAYEDTDASSEFHYQFTDDSGSNTHDIDVRGIRLL
jgi:hypothetical protein